MNIIDAALKIAVKAHAGQVDKGGFPYILHPLRVMAKMTNANLRCAAILHDVIEDTNVTWDDLYQAHIPIDVIVTVALLTRTEGQSWKDYIVDIALHDDARTVKIADLEDNLDVTRLNNIRDIKLEMYHAAWRQLRGFA